MNGTTRRSLLAAVGVGLASAGCLSNFEGGPGEARTEDAATTEATTESTATSDESTVKTTTEEITTEETGTEAGTRYASDSPEPDHSIHLRSAAAESQQVRVRIVREATGETVFEATEEATAGERTLYNLRQADPEGVEAFLVCAELVETGTAKTETATASPRRDCATVRTSECYGNAHVTVEEDGSVQIIYAIC